MAGHAQEGDVTAAEGARRSRAVLVYPSSITHESRLGRSCHSLVARGVFSTAEIVGVRTDDQPAAESFGHGCSVVRLPRAFDKGRGLAAKALKTLSWARRVLSHFAGARLACVSCHSLPSLPLCVSLARRTDAVLVYEPHELETETHSTRGVRKPLLKLLERSLLGRCAGVVVVSDSIADWYAREYGILRPAVVRNIPETPAGPAPEKSGILRSELGIPEGDPMFLYQGGLLRGRCIEQLLRVFSRTPEGRHVVFMGYGELEGMIRSAAATHRNIHFRPAVPRHEVLSYTADADIGLVGVENVCLSHYYSLPNKLFEYLLAGVPALGSDWPEIRRVIEADECGWVVGETDEDWLRIVRGVSVDEIHRKREGALQARLRYSWHDEENVLLAAYRRALSSAVRC